VCAKPISGIAFSNQKLPASVVVKKKASGTLCYQPASTAAGI
jgi:hypothetical protein